MTSEESPEGSLQSEETIQNEILTIEENLDHMHAEGRADKEGVLFRETAELPTDWLTFIERGEEILELRDPHFKEEFRMLIRKLLRDELNDKGADEARARLAHLKYLFEQKRRH